MGDESVMYAIFGEREIQRRIHMKDNGGSAGTTRPRLDMPVRSWIVSWTGTLEEPRKVEMDAATIG